MFVRAKQAGGRTYHYLVASERTAGGKVRQRTVAYLGRQATLEAAIEEVAKQIAWSEHYREVGRQRMAEALAKLGDPCPVPRPKRRGARWANKLRSSYWWWHEREEVAKRTDPALYARLGKFLELAGRNAQEAAAVVASVAPLVAAEKRTLSGLAAQIHGQV
jgi:hypothetical protein